MVDLEVIILSEVTAKYHMISLTCRLQNKPIYETNSPTDILNRLEVAKGGVEEEKSGSLGLADANLATGPPGESRRLLVFSDLIW